MTKEKTRRLAFALAGLGLAASLLFSAAFIGWRGWRAEPASALQVVIEQEGHIVYEALLQYENSQLVSNDEPLRLEGSAGEYVVEIQNGKVRMLSSHCPDKVCMAVGWTNKPTRPIICLPQRIIISVQYMKDGYPQPDTSDIDAVVK